MGAYPGARRRLRGVPTRAEIRRRRAVALGALATGALALGVALGAGDGDPGGNAPRGAAGRATATTRAAAPAIPTPAVEEAVDRLDGLQQAGTTIVLRFAGTRAPAYVLRALRERRAAGVILFADNVSGPAQLRALTRSVHRAAGDGPGLVMVDQEGGDIRIVPFAGPASGQARRTAADATPVARAAGRQLRALGVDVALGPVADAGRPGTALRGRSFSGDVADLTARTVRGWRAAGVLPTAKHFPGLGAAQTNTDFDAADIDVPRAELDRVDLPPFRAAIAAGVPLVMASHAVYPALDGDHIGSQSRAVLTTLLRGELGFRGVVITDSLEAEAVTSRSSTPVAAVRSMDAGADLLLTTGKGSYLQVLRAVRARQRGDEAFARRVRQAAARVLALG